jgi:pimeloyl-ACP methyl ester carboxylesterase
VSDAYRTTHESVCRFLDIRGWRYHVREWRIGKYDCDAPPLVMLHGYMDVSASFQFVVDAMQHVRHIVSIDWRGFGLTTPLSGYLPDSYWFPDYLGDLDAVLDALFADRAIDLLGHSMGGNIAMIYAGVRPSRIRRLINLEGFGLPDTVAAQAPGRYQRWLNQLREEKRLRSYATLEDVAARMQQSNPRLSTDKARWLANYWAQQEADGRWHLLSDPAHKRTNPILYRDDDIAACRKLITAPTLWVDGCDSELLDMFGGEGARAVWQSRLAAVPKITHLSLEACGHMLHHDQPQRLAAEIDAFLAT